MPDFYGGLKRRIMEGRPTPVRDYAAEVQSSIQAAQIKHVRGILARVLLESDLDDQTYYTLKDAHDALS